MGFQIGQFMTDKQVVLNYGVIQCSALSVEQSAAVQKPMVFIPGLGGSVKNAIEFLERLLPEVGPIYALDARGLGLNQDVSPMATPRGYLKDFNRFVSHLTNQGFIGVGNRPLLMGLSLGGVYAIEHVVAQSEHFLGMVLVAPAFLPHPAMFPWRFHWNAYWGVLQRGLSARIEMPYGIEALTRCEQKRQDPQYQNRLVLPTFYLLLVQWLCRSAYRHARQVKLPTLTIIPQADQVCCPEAMAHAASRFMSSNKPIMQYAGLYHDVMMEPEVDQQVMIQDIKAWIANL